MASTMTASHVRYCPLPGKIAAAIALVAMMAAGCASVAAPSRPDATTFSPGGPVGVRTLGAAGLAAADAKASAQANGSILGGQGDLRAGASYDAVRRYRAPRDYHVVPEPVRLQISVIGVDTSLERLARLPDGTIALPASPYTAGWYQDGPRPGEPGPAVIVGHVDSRTGPAVFYRLSALSPGDDMTITRADGAVLVFRVERLVRVPKTEFPTDLVYLPTLEPALRLVTCGGSFDIGAGHYRDNVVVLAVLAS